MRSHYNIGHNSFIPAKYHLFSTKSFGMLKICPNVRPVKKFHHSKCKTLAFVTIQEEPFPHPHCYGTGNFPSTLVYFPKSLPPLLLHSHVHLMCCADQYDHYCDVLLTIFKLSGPFSDMLH